MAKKAPVKPKPKVKPKVKPKPKMRPKDKVTKKKKIKPAIKWVFLNLVLIGAILALLLSPVFNIHDIVVGNNNKVETEDIISLSELETNTNMFKFLKLNVINRIKQNAYIEEVKIKRSLPDKIIIDVVERIPTYMLSIGGIYAYINNQGYILELSDEALELLVISGYKTDKQDIKAGNRLNIEDLITLEKIIEITNISRNNGILDQVIEFKIEDNRLVLELQNEKTAYIRDMANINIKIVTLRAILEREINKAGEIFLDGMNEKDTVIFREIGGSIYE